MAVDSVEPPVMYMLQTAIMEREPHVAAVIEGDTRYDDALVAVEDAKRAYEEWRDDTSVQRELGMSDYVAGLKARKEAVEVARAAFRQTPRPSKRFKGKQPKTGQDWERWDREDRRQFYRRAIAEVRVMPRSQGQRLFMRWAGSDTLFPLAPLPPIEDVTRPRKRAA